jgi:TRAP transporter TAXI family solute receptor
LIACGIACLTAPAAAQTVGIGTGPAASLTNRIGSAVAKVTNDAAGLKSRAIPHTSNSQHVPLVVRGRLQFGVNSTQQIDAAVKGEHQFKGHPQPDFRVAARLVPLPVGVIVRKNSAIKTMADLKGKKVPVGYTAQKTVNFIADAFYANAGIAQKDLAGVPVPNTHSGAQLFLQGKVDATLSSLGGGRLRTMDAKVDGIRILPMVNEPAAVKKMQAAYPNSYLIQLKPRKGSVGVSGPTWVMAFDMALMTSPKTPDDIVYKAVKALYNNKAALVKLSGVFRGFDPKGMARQYSGQRYHPGAIKFYKEVGIWPKS